MELNQTLPNGRQQIGLTIGHRNVGVLRPKKLGPTTLLHVFGFSTTSRLNGENLLNET